MPSLGRTHNGSICILFELDHVIRLAILLYKRASQIGCREFSCLVKNYRVVFHSVSSLRGNGIVVLANIDCCKDSCVIKNYQIVV
jgi:hypothetical protein